MRYTGYEYYSEREKKQLIINKFIFTLSIMKNRGVIIESYESYLNKYFSGAV